MNTIISGSFFGTFGADGGGAGGNGLTLPSPTAVYTVTSQGTVVGGAGYSFPVQYNYGPGFPDNPLPGGPGGVGVDMTAGGQLINFGLISGGHGGNGFSIYSQPEHAYKGGPGGAGGIGVLFPALGTLTNHGSITGGTGGEGGLTFGQADGPGGYGVDLAAGGLVVNDGQISGGGGSHSSYPFTIPFFPYVIPDVPANYTNGGNGAAGVLLETLNSTLENHGTIIGGIGGYGSSMNHSPRAGGAAGGNGGAGVELKAGGVVYNSALVAGGAGAAASSIYYALSGSGGAGILLDNGGVIHSSGTVTGGVGGSDNYGNGGAGIDVVQGGVVYNTGLVTGGAGGYGDGGPILEAFGGPGVGGMAITLGRNGLLVNQGTIIGGNGGPSGEDDSPGGDGAYLNGGGSSGVNLSVLGSLKADFPRSAAYAGVNLGLIEGGNDGTANYRLINYGSPLPGGVGVDIAHKAGFINAGTIVGGDYGIGITLAAGSTLANLGTIIGGSDGESDAVSFGAGIGSRLEVDAAAKFTGAVVASGSQNLIELIGPQLGTLEADNGVFHGFGTTLGGFQILQIDGHSTWAISGTVSNLRNYGEVEITAGNALDIVTTNIGSNGIFLLTGGASLAVTNVLGAGPKFDFIGGADELLLENAANFGVNVGKTGFQGPLIEDFGPGDKIDLAGISSNGLKLNYSPQTGVLQITASTGGVVASLQFQTLSLGAGSFHVASDGGGGSLITHS